MDFLSFLQTYGGPGGLAGAAVVWAIQSRKFDAERRAELREDIDREQADNASVRADNATLRAELVEERSMRIRAESKLERCQCEEGGAP